MKFNISYPTNGSQKTVEIDDDRKTSTIYDRRMGQEFEGEGLGNEFKGYVFKITGGNDKQGFPMRQGIMVKGRVRILMAEGQKTFRIRRDGHRKRKSVRGCIVGQDLRVVALQIVKKGDEEIPGLTDVQNPLRLGPKRVNKIRKLFAIKKSEDKSNVLVKKSVVRRTFTSATGKERQKAPKIQRLITPDRIRTKRIRKQQKVNNWKNGLQLEENYKHLVSEYKLGLKKAHRKESLERKASQDETHKQTKTATTAKTANTGKAQTKPVVPAKTETKQVPKTVAKDTKTTVKPVETKTAVTTAKQTTQTKKK